MTGAGWGQHLEKMRGSTVVCQGGLLGKPTRHSPDLAQPFGCWHSGGRVGPMRGSGLILPSRIGDPQSAWLWGTTSHTSHFLTSISGWAWGRGWGWGWAWARALLVSRCEEGGLTEEGGLMGPWNPTVWGRASVLCFGPEGARIGPKSHGVGVRGILCLASLWAMPVPRAPSPLPCLNSWLFWELLATT